MIKIEEEKKNIEYDIFSLLTCERHVLIEESYICIRVKLIFKKNDISKQTEESSKS